MTTQLTTNESAATTAQNRIVESVTGYDAMVSSLALRAKMWNECNGEGRMRLMIGSRTEYVDDEGSGEFFKAVCLNSNEAESCDQEIWEIQTCW